MKIPPCETQLLWHVTVLSNFARGYEKYARIYSKVRISESTFPDRFFLLEQDELQIGISKASKLLAKLNLPGDRLIGLQTRIPLDALRPNQQTGLGRYVESPNIRVNGVAFVESDGLGVRRIPTSVEELNALSLRLAQPDLADYTELKPRSFSVLPIARGCQASCPFCFSKASVSAEQEQARLDLNRVRDFANNARVNGAERFVITGGGEPGLVSDEKLCELITIGSEVFGKTVLITNGHHLARHGARNLTATLQGYTEAGLNVLAISRHHHDDKMSERLMQLQTDVAAIAETWRAGSERWPDLLLRFTCVLQRGGVDSMAALESYVDWASELGVPELCFKELYVSTSVESVYHRHAANAWSFANQVPLATVIEFAARYGFVETARLPWGSPIFSGNWRGRFLRIAAYTEPSLFWERANRVARSWNLMADGSCLASLEDRASAIQLPVAA